MQKIIFDVHQTSNIKTQRGKVICSLKRKQATVQRKDIPAPRPNAKPNTKESTASTAMTPCTPSSTGLTSTIERTNREPSL